MDNRFLSKTRDQSETDSGIEMSREKMTPVSYEGELPMTSDQPVIKGHQLLRLLSQYKMQVYSSKDQTNSKRLHKGEFRHF